VAARAVRGRVLAVQLGGYGVRQGGVARLPRRDLAGGEVALVLEGFRQRGDVAAQAGELVDPREDSRGVPGALDAEAAEDDRRDRGDDDEDPEARPYPPVPHLETGHGGHGLIRALPALARVLRGRGTGGLLRGIPRLQRRCGHRAAALIHCRSHLCFRRIRKPASPERAAGTYR